MSGVETIQAYAVDMLADWLPGYTMSDAEGELRVRVLYATEHNAVIETQSVGLQEPGSDGRRTYRIDVFVTEEENY
jgi:hypothetical protein